MEGVDDTKSKRNSTLDSNAWESSESDGELNFSKTKVKESVGAPVNSLKRKHSTGYSNSECESDVSTNSENRLVIDCSDSDRSPEKKSPRSSGKNISLKSAKNNNVEEDTRVTRSKAELIAEVLSVNQSLGQKPVQFVADRGHEIDMSSEDTPETTDGSKLEKSVKNVRQSDSFNIKENTSYSEVTNKVSVGTVVPNHIESCINTSVRHQEKKSKEAALILSTPGCNVSYRLWKLSKDEGHLNDQKEGFLKGDCSNREIKVLVRCKVDGYEVNFCIYGMNSFPFLKD
jgi:hypothetical protein